MRTVLILLIVLLYGLIVCSQQTIFKTAEKPVLDMNGFNNWPSVTNFNISNDGKFVYYTTRYGNDYSKQDITIKSLSGDWQIDIIGIKAAISFSSDSKKLLCLTKGDSLGVVTLGKSQINYVSSVQSFQLIENNNSEYLVYQKTQPANKVIIQNLETNKAVAVNNVLDYRVAGDKTAMVIKIDSVVNGQHSQFLFWNKLDGVGTATFICEGKNISNLALNNKGNGLAFTKENNGLKSIWFYSLEDNLLNLLCDSNSQKLKDLEVDGISGFSKDGFKLFIKLKEKPLPKPKGDFVKVNVWSFTDGIVQSRQNSNPSPQSYLAVMGLKDGKLIRLQYENDEINPFNGNDSFIYCIQRKGDLYENYWNNAANGKAFLVSKSDATRKLLDNRFNNAQFSSDGQYVISYDKEGRDIFSYKFLTGQINNLTKTIPVSLPSENLLRDIGDRPAWKYSRGLSFAAWKQGDKILVCDEFDIWEVDLQGTIPPVNITKGIGRRNGIEFRLTNLNADKVIAPGERVIVSAFHRKDKKSGFYEIILGNNTDPRLLSMNDNKFSSSFGVQPIIKAKEAEIYLVQRESATESPNLYWTKDFKTFTIISSIFPEKEYNWLTSELKSFKTLDGRTEQGVLYKPENFNAQNKYPVIIHYYENKSNDLNKFFRPQIDNGSELDIAWFVSHGYIVFTPDIHYKIGETGRSAYNAIVAAANYLKTLPYINGKKIGLQGHSFGGYETNYVVASSKLFAAAISSSGPSNFITGYLSDNPLEQRHAELNQNRLGKMLWEDIPMYIENSPVFRAYNVTTPILTIANRRDNSVPFLQGLEWFMGLRRLGKRAWMLQYDDGGHGLINCDDYIDYVIRSTQFFDHYLKDSACPKWMLYGIPAKDKGIDDGLELVKEKDKTGKWLTPKEGGLLTDEQRKKVQALMKLPHK